MLFGEAREFTEPFSEQGQANVSDATHALKGVGFGAPASPVA